MGTKVISIRLTQEMLGYIELIKKMRAYLFQSQTGIQFTTQSTTEIIERAILRLYNETTEYWIQECENGAYKPEFQEYVKEIFDEQ